MKLLFTSIALAFLSFGNAQTFKIDTKEAVLNFNYVSEETKGTISNISATIDLNLANLSSSKIYGSADVTSLSTGNIARDKHLKSKTYFDAKAFPTMSFKSSEFKVEPATETQKEQTVVNGTINLKGFNKPAKFVITTENGDLILTSSIYADDFGVAIKKGRENSLVTIEMRFPAAK